MGRGEYTAKARAEGAAEAPRAGRMSRARKRTSRAQGGRAACGEGGGVVQGGEYKARRFGEGAPGAARAGRGVQGEGAQDV